LPGVAANRADSAASPRYAENIEFCSSRRNLDRLLGAILTICCLCAGFSALAYDGPFGIDHKVPLDESGIWARNNQVAVEYGVIAAALGVALYQGSDDRMGGVAWKSLDSMLVTAAIVQVAKPVFSRARPTQTNDPGDFFQGKGHNSFPSGEVAHVAAAITPALMEYGQEQPWLYAAGGSLLAYDAIARVKSNAHWQSDVIAGAATGVATGYFMQKRDKSLIVSTLPGGVFVGYSKKW
jgi:undecaprenyl-diphosphatase